MNFNHKNIELINDDCINALSKLKTWYRNRTRRNGTYRRPRRYIDGRGRLDGRGGI